MKRNFFLFLVSIPCLAIAQQPSQADLDKMQKNVQQKVDAMKNDPKYKQYFNNSSANNNSQFNNIQQANMPINLFGSSKPDTAFLNKIKVPAKNNVALASVPAKTLTKTELTNYVRGMKNKLIPAIQTENVYTPVAESAYDAGSLSNAAIMTWYMNQPVGDEALVLALEGVEKDPDNLNALNTLSGILTLCGIPEKAIPILDYIRQQEPDNSTVNNNLGQAYAALGDQQKAITYLQKAIARSPDHTNANLSLACISYANGNKNAAKKYCENSLRGGYISDAWSMLKAIDPKASLMDYVRHRYKQPDFFNPHKYPLPEQCKSTDQVDALTVKYRQFNNMLLDVKDKYRRMLDEERKYISANLANDVMKKVRQQKPPLRPFGNFAVIMMGDIFEQFGEKVKKLSAYDSTYTKKVKELADQFNQKTNAIENSPGDPCPAVNGLSNEYMPQFASLNEERQREWINQTKNYYNDYAFWCYVASVDDHQYHQYFYQLVIQYLDMLNNLATTELLQCKPYYTYTKDKDAAFQFEEGKCPFKAKIDVEVEEKGEKSTPASFDIDCEQFAAKIKMGNGVSFNMKTTSAGSTTLAFTGGLSIGEVLGGSMQCYMTFGGNQPFDVGFNWDYEMKLPNALGGKNTAGWGVS
ncbi:MAG TPA: tetratricopeptide repeat protein, partial [Puia sp.]|nr:tetratricopeptide repeat protein [Puia sp.]